MNIALVYALVALFTIVFAAPVALLAPVLFAVVIPTMPVDEAPAQTETIVDMVAMTAEQAPSVVCAPFVRVYAGRGESRPAVHPWSLCQPTPAVYPLSRTGKPLRGAALRAATAKACRKGCTSHACPTVAS